MNRKFFIAYLLIICIFVSYIIPDSQVYASYELREDQKEWKTGKTAEMKEMLSLLQRYEFFSDMNEKEQIRIVEFYGIDRELITITEESGIGLPDSLNLASINKTMKFTPEELIKIYKDYENIEELIEAVMEFDSCLARYSLDENVKNRLKHYLIEGYSPGNIVFAYVLSIILEVPPEELLQKAEKNDQGSDAIDFYSRYEVNYEFLSGYAMQNGMTLEEIESRVTDYFLRGDMTVTSGEQTEIQYTKYLQDPYRFNENTNESISPDNGNLTIENTVVSLKGINGLDLNITARYRLSDAHLYLYDYKYVPMYCRDAYYFTEAYYANDSGYFEPVNCVYAIPIKFSGYNPGDPYIAAADFEVYFQTGPYDRNGNICYYCYTRQIQWLSEEYIQVVVENGTDSNTYTDKTYNLGTGWGFCFSSIELQAQMPEASVTASSIARYALEKYVSDHIVKRYGTKIFIEVSTADATKEEHIKSIWPSFQAV